MSVLNHEMIESTTDRQERIPGFMQSLLRNAKVMVIGAGATGNEVLKNLALTGFGYVFITDMDTISTSNLSRTVLFSPADVGKPKAETAAHRFIEMNIAAGRAEYLNGDACMELGEGVFRRFDLVINCVDNDQTRLFVSEICQRLEIPFIDIGIGGFNWNVFVTSSQKDSPCFACTMSTREEEGSLARFRNSCDVTRLVAVTTDRVPTIAVSSSMAAAKAVEEAIKVLHHKADPYTKLPKPQYGYMWYYNGETSAMSRIRFTVRNGCRHHDHYSDIGSIVEAPFSVRSRIRDVLDWVKERYKNTFTLSLYKDCSCADRAFVTTGRCVHCGKPISIFRPQASLLDEDLLCVDCRMSNYSPTQLSEAVLKTSFSMDDENKILNMSLSEIGIPKGHIIFLEPDEDSQSPLLIELSEDIHEIITNCSE